MLIIPFVLFMIYIFSAYLFDKFKLIMTFMTMVMGLVFLLNDWNNTVVPDDTLKLAFLLSFLLYSLMIIANIIFREDD